MRGDREGIGKVSRRATLFLLWRVLFSKVIRNRELNADLTFLDGLAESGSLLSAELRGCTAWGQGEASFGRIHAQQ